MKIQHLVNIIPGYELLTEDEQAIFLDTCAGRDLIDELSGTKISFFTSLKYAINTVKEKFLLEHENDLDYLNLLDTIKNHRTALDQLLNTACEKYCSELQINLKTFNDSQIQKLSSFLLNSSIITDVEKNNWLEHYKNELRKYLETHLTLIDNDPSFLKSLNTLNINKENSLSKFFSSILGQDKKESLVIFLNKVADAHGFIQATGFATQNENSFLSWVDLWNYSRSSEYIAETKLAFARLMEPFNPLWAEYHDITHQERNMLRLVLRTLIPLIIISAVIIAVCVLLSPLVIPDLAFLFILIPTLYTGFLAASSYVLIKDSIYHSLRELYFGGKFNIPEYQVNQRIKTGFVIDDLAKLVRDFYVNEMKTCFEKETFYRSKGRGLLEKEELDDRKKNAIRIGTLQLEWYDIHSNDKIGVDEIQTIAINRLHKDYQNASAMLKLQAFNQLDTVVDDIVNKIDQQWNIDNRPIAATNLFNFETVPTLFNHRKKLLALYEQQKQIKSADISPSHVTLPLI